MCEIGWKTT